MAEQTVLMGVVDMTASRCGFRGSVRWKNCARRLRMSVPDSVGKWGVSGDVLDRALDAAYADPRWSNGHLYPEGWADFEDGLKLAAPIIAEAGYRQGVEDAKARIQEVKLGPHANREEIETFRAEVDAVLTALTDTEGRDE